MNVIGHTSRTGTVQYNDRLSDAARDLHQAAPRQGSAGGSSSARARQAWASARTSWAPGPTTRVTRSTGGSVQLVDC